jgi:hypothetical protein
MHFAAESLVSHVIQELVSCGCDARKGFADASNDKYSLVGKDAFSF